MSFGIHRGAKLNRLGHLSAVRKEGQNHSKSSCFAEMLPFKTMILIGFSAEMLILIEWP